MRQQRPAMVQAKDQYIFVYLAVAELSKRALGMKPNVPRKPNGRVRGYHYLVCTCICMYRIAGNLHGCKLCKIAMHHVHILAVCD